MIIEFRTDRDRNGNAKYLAFDTVAEIYSTQCRTWISKDLLKLSRTNYKELINQLNRSGYKKVDYVC